MVAVLCKRHLPDLLERVLVLHPHDNKWYIAELHENECVGSYFIFEHEKVANVPAEGNVIGFKGSPYYIKEWMPLPSEENLN